MSARRYDQSCPIAIGLDVLGERWTLLILSELFGGPRRYSDLRAALPGIATNLLAERLRGLEDVGLIERNELPPPIARTMYSLTDFGWRKVPPVLKAIAMFGMELLTPADTACTPLNGLLVGILLGFDPTRVGDLEASYRIDVDGRRFDVAVHQQRLAAPRSAPDVSVTATAADLITARFGPTPAKRQSALQRLTFCGNHDAVDAMRAIFRLTAEPVDLVLALGG